MNTNSNLYTIIYSIILVVVVAAVLAFAAMFLKPTQEDNVKIDTISQILTAAGISYSEDANILEIYKDNISKAILVNTDGDVLADTLITSDIKKIQVYSNSELKAQKVTIEKKEADPSDTTEVRLPVYIFKNGISVVPCYGAGLWGPIWGYIGVNSDLTIVKAYFGHKGETPGLGAKITDEPEIFADLFSGKKITEPIKVGKGVNPERKAEINAVDAISGATITSNATGVMVNQWLKFYEPYFAKLNKCSCCEHDCASMDQTEEIVEQPKTEEN